MRSHIILELTYLLNGLVEGASDLALTIPRAQLTAALEPLLLPETAALEEVTLPLVLSVGPVLALGGVTTSLA